MAFLPTCHLRAPPHSTSLLDTDRPSHGGLAEHLCNWELMKLPVHLTNVLLIINMNLV